MDRVRASSVMQRSRVNIDGIMRSARNKQGLEHLDQIRFAVLEADGEITIIPRQHQAKRYRGVRHVSLEEGTAGWGTWIRTKIDGVRVRSSTIELFPKRWPGNAVAVAYRVRCAF